MATPTPSTNTPSKNLAAFSSPAPRSVPHTGAPNMLSYDSPAVLNMLTDGSSGLGGVGMGISMSGLGMSSLGMSASSMGRADEAERSRRLRVILDTISSKPGRVSEAGVFALCNSLGIGYEKVGEGLVLMIGEEVMCDLIFRNERIEKLELQTAFDQDDLPFGATASPILFRSLQPSPGQSDINVTLERFSESLQKLRTLDQLGQQNGGGVSCFEAIAGVYRSLRKLFEHEKKAELAAREPDERYRTHKAEREVICKKSGRPRLNGGSYLGLSLEYWMDRRHLIPPNLPDTSEKGKDKMDVDSSLTADLDHGDSTTYSLQIECESSPATLYTPVRVSNEWIGDQITKTADADIDNIDNMLLDKPSVSIDWLDPKPTYLEASGQGDDAMNLDSAPGRLPNIRFVAKFNPPLVVPWAVHVDIMRRMGIEPRPEDFQPTTFVGLVLRPGEMDPAMDPHTGESTHEIKTSQVVLVQDKKGNESMVKHEMSLYMPKMEYSKTLESLPFSHPKQLIEVLPILRQFACITSILKGSFYEKPSKSTIAVKSQAGSVTSPAKDAAVPSLQLDTNLSYVLPPRLTLHIPHPSSTSTTTSNLSVSDLLSTLLAPASSTSSSSSSHPSINLTLDVHANAEFVLMEQNMIDVPTLTSTGGGSTSEEKEPDVNMDKVQEAQNRVKRVARALDVCGDLSVWAEWVRREFAEE